MVWFRERSTLRMSHGRTHAAPLKLQLGRVSCDEMTTAAEETTGTSQKLESGSVKYESPTSN